MKSKPWMCAVVGTLALVSAAAAPCNQITITAKTFGLFSPGASTNLSPSQFARSTNGALLFFGTTQTFSATARAVRAIFPSVRRDQVLIRSDYVLSAPLELNLGTLEFNSNSLLLSPSTFALSMAITSPSALSTPGFGPPVFAQLRPLPGLCKPARTPTCSSSYGSGAFVDFLNSPVFSGPVTYYNIFGQTLARSQEPLFQLHVNDFDLFASGTEEIIGTLSPVPEMSTLLLVGTGILALAGVCRRKLMLQNHD
jgi:hypothetical protein